MVHRWLEELLRQSSKSVLLLGPRQVGKSTLIHALKPDWVIDLSRESDFRVFSGNTSELEQGLAANSDVRTIFIDEIQRLPSMLNTIQFLLDTAQIQKTTSVRKKSSKPPKNKSFQFYLTGSSARKLRRGGANLLPGRIFTYQLGPLAACELEYDVDSARVLETGFLPEIYLSSERNFQEKLLESYAATYLREEIQAEALTRNLEGFSRFIDVAATHAGRILDFSKVSSKAHVSRQSCVRFFEILEDTMIGLKILPCPLLHEEADMTKHPRFYFFDVGVLNGILGNFVASSDRRGVLAEHVVLNQIMQSAYAKDKRVNVWGFRTRGGLEIDFLAQIDKHMWAIEVKSSDHVSSDDLRGLKQFSNYYSEPYDAVVATMGGRSKKIEGIWVLPWQKLLREMGL